MTAKMFADAGYRGNMLERYTSNYNIFYCWGRDSSNALILGTTEEYQGHDIQEKIIRSIPSDNDRLSLLYHIQVYQSRLSKAGYDYRREMQENVEKAGGIFAPIFSVTSGGNIRNVHDNTERVIGFVDVATTTTKDIYIETAEVEYHEKYTYCEPEYASNPADVRNNGYYWFRYDQGLYVRDSYCVGCRSREKATKDKPAWWPNTHV